MSWTLLMSHTRTILFEAHKLRHWFVKIIKKNIIKLQQWQSLSFGSDLHSLICDLMFMCCLATSKVFVWLSLCTIRTIEIKQILHNCATTPVHTAACSPTTPLTSPYNFSAWNKFLYLFILSTAYDLVLVVWLPESIKLPSSSSISVACKWRRRSNCVLYRVSTIIQSLWRLKPTQGRCLNPLEVLVRHRIFSRDK